MEQNIKRDPGGMDEEAWASDIVEGALRSAARAFSILVGLAVTAEDRHWAGTVRQQIWDRLKK